MVNEETKAYLENIPVKERTENQHYLLIKMYGGVREYLLSMGPFKEILYLAQIDTHVEDARINFVGEELYERLKKKDDPHVWKVQVLERGNQ